MIDWKKWREDAEARWKEPNGWLSLVSLDWLSAEPQTLQHFPGLWSVDGHRVTATFLAEDNVTQGGKPVTQVTLEIAPEDSDLSLLDSQGRIAEVASRYGQIGIRVRDPQSPALTAYQGIDTFDPDPAWVIQGAWTPYAQPQTITVGSAQPGQHVTQTAWGEATFPGLPHAQPVIVTGQNLDDLLIIFTDTTNGESTAAWRHAPVAVTDNVATVDFNRAANFPAHFTSFGTCPMAPVANHFDTAITAGERRATTR